MQVSRLLGVVVVALLAGCTHKTRPGLTASEWNTDHYECTSDSTRPQVYTNTYTGQVSSMNATDPFLYQMCMKARGYRDEFGAPPRWQR